MASTCCFQPREQSRQRHLLQPPHWLVVDGEHRSFRARMEQCLPWLTWSREGVVRDQSRGKIECEGRGCFILAVREQTPSLYMPSTASLDLTLGREEEVVPLSHLR